jgi:hypothetical protein
MTETPINRARTDVQCGRDESQDDAEEWDGEEGSYDEAEGDIDAAAEAQAEEIARRLGDQLWESINKARAESVTASQSSPSGSATVISKRDEAALTTMRRIIACLDKDPLARTIFTSTPAPGRNGENLFEVLARTVAAGSIPKEAAQPLSNLLVSLARSEILFGGLRQSCTESVGLETGKRKRAEADDDAAKQHSHPIKRSHHAPYNLQRQVGEAVRIITNAFAMNDHPGPLPVSVISSVQLQLHQVFLFAVTSSVAGGPEMSALRELSGLIQVLGVLSGIQIGAAPTHPSGQPPPQLVPYDSTAPWVASHAPDIGTAVYPCLSPSCHKYFSRLFSLRAHQRGHAIHRPFRCTSCPASFARNHDLKRHAKLHESKAWKCCGCGKVFSRRDAIKRHKNNESSKGLDGELCLDKEVVEVDVSKEGAETGEGRRAKMWAGVGTTPTSDEKVDEEGAIPHSVISQLQADVLSLSGLLRTHARDSIGTASSKVTSTDVGPTAGQATLASIIARVQALHQQGSISTTAEGPLDPQSGPTSTPQPESHTSGVAGQKSVASESPSAEVPLAAYGLSAEQTRMLQQAIANAASAAQAQAEAEAAMEEEEEECEGDIDDPMSS